MSEKRHHWMGLTGRGMAMGVAEVVPGVSGGTIAFVTGIYDELVRTLAGFSHRSVTVLFSEGLVSFWRVHNLRFLALLVAGMAVAIVLFARLMSYLLATVPTLVWGFFFGLIALSVWQIGRAQPKRSLVIFAPLGVLAGLALGMLDPLPTDQALWVSFAGGVVAISAWMLPAVSGSFMLLVLGLYHAVIDAVTNFQWAVLASVALGCGVGLLAFSKVLAWLLCCYLGSLMDLLSVFIDGSLQRLRPCMEFSELLSPVVYQDAVGDPLVLGTILCVCAGGVALWLLTRLE